MKLLKIGTRDSILALWQANKVKSTLQEIGVESELIAIKTKGDLVLDKSLPSIGGKGLFTAELDAMMMHGDIDIAVHSYKDLPVEETTEILVGAVLQRDDYRDCIVKNVRFETFKPEIIATSSNRRKAFLLNKYPHLQIETIRGNVQTRLRKLDESNWNAAVFASAGLKRLQLDSKIFCHLDWMLPAPAQGAIAITYHAKNNTVKQLLQKINCIETQNNCAIERDFLHKLDGGCSSPVGAICIYSNHIYELKASILTIDGKQRIDVVSNSENNQECVQIAVNMAFDKGVEKILAFNNEYHS